MTFRETLNIWRGKRGLKQVAEILGVSYGTIVNWACRDHEPSDVPSKKEILDRMAANPEVKPE